RRFHRSRQLPLAGELRRGRAAAPAAAPHAYRRRHGAPLLSSSRESPWNFPLRFRLPFADHSRYDLRVAYYSFGKNSTTGVALLSSTPRVWVSWLGCAFATARQFITSCRKLCRCCIL